MMKLLRFWPPYWASGISVVSYNDDFSEIKVQLVQRKTNTNVVGTHFGGSLYSMCDPFFMFILLEHLGEDHIVWDQAASIDFVRPGRGTVTAEFKIGLREIDEIREKARLERNVRPKFYAEVKDSQGAVVARLHKTLYVKKKVSKELLSIKP